MSQGRDEADQVLVRATRYFVGDEGMKDETSEPFKVSRLRAADLKASGLVEDHKAQAVKAAPQPENKMATPPGNKAVEGASQLRRGRD